jgi:hypothetical protein
MTSKFEQLIEYVINDEEAKAKQLFHDIVVEKSREIYENLMNEECDTCHKDPCMCEDEEEDLEEGMDMPDQDPAGALIDDVEAEEEGLQMEEEEDDEDVKFDNAAEKDGKAVTHDMEKDHDAADDIEGRVANLEDELDALMAEFEAMMNNGDQSVSSVSDIDGGDALEMDDTATAEFGSEDPDNMMENITLAAAPKPVTTEPAGTNAKSTVAANSGAKGMQGAPVKMTGDTAKGRPAPSVQAITSEKFQNTPASGSKKMTPATKPVTTQAAGTNDRTPFPR